MIATDTAPGVPIAVLQVDPEFRALIPPLSGEELAGLEALIVGEGCRDPLVVWGGQDIVLDGHHRLDICTRHAIPFKTIALQFPDRDAAKSWMIRNQFARRNLTPFQRAELALALEPLIRAKAKQRQRAAGGPLPQNSAEAPIETRREVAKLAGVSHDTIDKARVIAEQAPEAVKLRLRNGTTTIPREYRAVVAARRKAEQVEAIQAARLPAGRYHVLVVDPPWQYEKRPDDPSHRATCPYPVMSIEEIAALPIAELCHTDAIVWLWATNAHMAEAYRVADAWGLTVKSILTWGKQRIGCGDWLRGQTEHCLLCVKGRPVVTLGSQSTLLLAPAREHSRKPDEFYALVESLCPGSKCELFAREGREDWACHGAEVGMFKGEAKP